MPRIHDIGLRVCHQSFIFSFVHAHQILDVLFVFFPLHVEFMPRQRKFGAKNLELAVGCDGVVDLTSLLHKRELFLDRSL